MKQAPLLDVQDLCVSFTAPDVPEHSGYAVKNISFSINKGETLCLVGESGCGKSMTARALMGLIPEYGFVSAKKFQFAQYSLAHYNPADFLKIRGKEMSMIFQEPMTALNPVLTVGFQVAEVLRLHKKLSKKEAKAVVVDLFHKLGIVNPEKCFNAYPHELSGGMRQRIIIAMALVCDPQLIVADEPTTALDVSIQSQILQLLQEQCAERTMGMLFITHNLGVVAKIAHHVAVMYAGTIVEYADVNSFFKQTLHPYAQGLLNALPSKEKTAMQPLPTIAGTVPSIFNQPAGCAFSKRCEKYHTRCDIFPPLFTMPQLSENKQKKESIQQVRCWLYKP